MLSLHEFNILSGISNGLDDQLSFFLTSFISSSPRGAPWDDALPDLFGDPKPIIVLQDIIVGFFDLCAFLIACEICL